MPRTSSDALALASFRSEPARLEPPPDLIGTARQVFIDTVNGTDARPSDMALLTTFCQTAALEQEAARKLGKRLVVKGRASPMVAVHASLVRTLLRRAAPTDMVD